jgi:energy-coupling factor transporter ATP-binding protein EcfA2
MKSKPGLRVQIIGHDGACGKTTLQVLLKELLEARGFEIVCSEVTPLHTLEHRDWERLVNRLHKGAAKRKLHPMRVNIDVIAI